jgi:hypothetical protein
MSERDQRSERPGTGGQSIEQVTARTGDGGGTELFLTIENAIEDRVRTYRQLLRMKQVLAGAQRAADEK